MIHKNHLDHFYELHSMREMIHSLSNHDSILISVRLFF